MTIVEIFFAMMSCTIRNMEKIIFPQNRTFFGFSNKTLFDLFGEIEVN
jgi:hypothetical protein